MDAGPFKGLLHRKLVFLFNERSLLLNGRPLPFGKKGLSFNGRPFSFSKKALPLNKKPLSLNGPTSASALRERAHCALASTSAKRWRSSLERAPSSLWRTSWFAGSSSGQRSSISRSRSKAAAASSFSRSLAAPSGRAIEAGERFDPCDIGGKLGITEILDAEAIVRRLKLGASPRASV